MSLITSIKMQLQRAKADYSQAIFEQDANARALEEVTAKIGNYTAATGSSSDNKNDSIFKELVSYQTACETRKTSLDSQVSLYKEQIDSYKSALKDSIHDANNWWGLA